MQCTSSINLLQPPSVVIVIVSENGKLSTFRLWRRFGGVSQPTQDRIADAPIYSVESWFDRAISSDSLADVFDEPGQVTH